MNVEVRVFSRLNIGLGVVEEEYSIKVANFFLWRMWSDGLYEFARLLGLDRAYNLFDALLCPNK